MQATLSWSKGSVKRPLLSKENLGRLTINMVTESLLPMSFVDQPSFKELIPACQPEVELPTRYSITKGLEKRQEDAMAKVEWISTTTDCWSAHRRSYLGVTAHWLSADSFNRESAALACQRIMEVILTTALLHTLKPYTAIMVSTAKWSKLPPTMAPIL